MPYEGYSYDTSYVSYHHSDGDYKYDPYSYKDNQYYKESESDDSSDDGKYDYKRMGEELKDRLVGLFDDYFYFSDGFKPDCLKDKDACGYQ